MTYCTSCGTPRESGSQFCTGCGEQVSSASSTRPHTRGRFAVIVTALVLVLGGGGVVTWTALTHRADAPASPSLLPTPSLLPQSPAEVFTSMASDPPAGVNSGGTALDQLTRQISLDRPQIQSDLAETWVPQLSSKRLGTKANGISYGYTEILNDHVALRSTYGARLVWSGDWSTFNRGDFYVTVAPVPFNTPAEANAWCDRQAIDSTNCFAKRLSTTAGTGGSTVPR
jgi:serine/threonine kinase PknH